jgi:hypothetical protein
MLFMPCLAECLQAVLCCFSVFQPVRKPAITLNWSELRKVPRQQRREMRLKMHQESDAGVSSDRSDELR